MLNQVIVVGRLTQNPEIKELESGKKVSTITLAVSRAYKNEEGLYDTDFIQCVLLGAVASNTAEYCRKGDIVGVKGRLETEKNNEKYELQIVAEKVTFLSSKKPEEKEGE